MNTLINLIYPESPSAKFAVAALAGAFGGYRYEKIEKNWKSLSDFQKTAELLGQIFSIYLTYANQNMLSGILAREATRKWMNPKESLSDKKLMTAFFVAYAAIQIGIYA